MLRSVFALMSLMTLLIATMAVATAQATTAGPRLQDLNLPEVVVTASESGFAVPAEIAAGAVLLTLDNQAPFPAGFSIIRLPDGMEVEDLLTPPDPAASPATSPTLPPALYDTAWAGGAFAMPGARTSSVVSLSAGTWLVVPPPDIPVPPAVMTVTGETDTTIQPPEGAVAIELDNFQIRLPDQLPAGHQVWHVANAGDQPHEMIISRTPERLTAEQAAALATLPPDAAPDPSLPNPEAFEQVAFIAPLSQGQAVLAELDLEPGHYVAVCFIPERESGHPHATKGMVTVFSIGVEGEEVAPPASPEPL